MSAHHRVFAVDLRGFGDSAPADAAFDSTVAARDLGAPHRPPRRRRLDIGVLAAPGIPEMLLAGRERAFIADYAIPSLSATPAAFAASRSGASMAT